MQNKKQGIYSITVTENNSVYVGQSVDIARRWHQHRQCLRDGKHQNSHMQRIFNKYGETALVFRVLEISDSPLPEELTLREEWWLSHFRMDGFSIINQRIVANSNLGFRISPESRAKMSEAQRGRKLSVSQIESMRLRMLGTKHSAETRAKMSESQKGRKMTQEQRVSLSRKQRGRKLSVEHCAKLSAVRMGVKLPPFTDDHKQKIGMSNARKYLLVSPNGDTKEVFNLCKFCRDNNLDQGHLYKVKAGKQSNHKGWKFA